MSLRTFSIAARGLLITLSLSGCAALAAHHKAFLGNSRSQPVDLISGSWSVTFNDHGNALPATFNLKLEGTRVTGTVYAEKTGEGTIRNGKWEDNELSFTVEFKQHQSLIVEGVFKDGKLAGECHHPDGPVYKWEAERAPQSDDSISGEWVVTFYVHEMKTPASFTFKVDGAKVTGAAFSDHTGPGTIRDGKWIDGKLSFTLDFMKHESIAVNGILKEGKLTGEFSTEGFTDKWEAVRK
jgi:hypothetical protein